MKVTPPSLRCSRALRRGAFAITLTFGLLASWSRAQPAPAGPAAAEAAKKAESDVIALNPFEVQADSDTSYGALNSSSITRFPDPSRT